MKTPVPDAKKLLEANPKVNKGEVEEALRIIRALRESGQRSATDYNLESPYSRSRLLGSKPKASSGLTPELDPAERW